MTNAIATTPPESKEKGQSLIVRMASAYDMEPAKFAETIKATCIKGRASNEQFAAFLMVADKYGLNPLTKEIYAFPQDGGIVPIVGVDGWSRIINNHPQFNGMSFVDHREDGTIIAITCRMHRRDRDHPVEATEYLSECKRGTVPWKQWPVRMLRHKAMIQAARYAFGYTGIIDEDEWSRRSDKIIDAEPRPNIEERFIAAAQASQEPVSDESDVEEAEIMDASDEPDDGATALYEAATNDEPIEDTEDHPGDLASPQRAGDDGEAGQPPSEPASPTISKPIAQKVDQIRKAKSPEDADSLFEAFTGTDLGNECSNDEFEAVKEAVAWRKRQG